MKKINQTQKTWLIIGLCFIVLFMVVGYASFSQSLTITGTSTIESNWDIKITNISVKNIIGGATSLEQQVTNDTSATFKTNLVRPEDSITYEITVSNNGTIPAKLNKLTVTDANNPAILFNITGINENDVLGEHSNTTFDVTVTYNPTVTSQPEKISSTLNVALDYVQNSGSLSNSVGRQ